MTLRHPRADAALAQAFRLFVWAIPLTVAWTVAGVHIAIGIAAALVLVRAGWTRTWTLRRTPVDFAALAFAGAYALATLTAADRGASAYTLRKLLLFLVVHFVVAAAGRPDRVRWCVRVFVGGIALTALVAAVRFVVEQHVLGSRLRSTGHYMTFAGLILLAAPPALVAAWEARGRLRVLYGAASAVLVASLLLSFTRGAWLGMTVGLAAIVARSRPRLAWLVPLAVALGFALAPSGYRARALSSFDPHHPMNVDRIRLWRAAVDIWRDHPWTGVGLVDLKPYYLQYRHGTEGQVHGHFHNNVLQILVTTGVAGLLAFLWLLVAMGRVCWGSGPPGTDAELRAARRGIWGAYCGFLVMGLFEWNFGDVEVTIALCFLVGTAWAAARVAFSAPAAAAGAVAAPPAGSMSH